MNNDFRSQTTELVTLFPFKGTGKVNDRLRFDTSGLTPGINYILVYNPTTSAFTWSNVDSAGVDTLYTADGTIDNTTRTVALQNGGVLAIDGAAGDGNYFSTQIGNNDNYVGLFIEDGSVKAESGYAAGDIISSSIVQVPQESSQTAFSIASLYEDSNNLVEYTTELFVGTDDGLNFQQTVSGDGATTGYRPLVSFELSNENLESYAEFELEVGEYGGAYLLELSDDPNGFDYTEAINSDLSGMAVGIANADFLTTFELTANNNKIVTQYTNDNTLNEFIMDSASFILRFTDNNTESVSKIEAGNEGLSVNYSNATLSSVVETSLGGVFMQYSDGDGESEISMSPSGLSLSIDINSTQHTINLANQTFIELDSVKVASGIGSITGTGGTDITFTLPDDLELFNATVNVSIVCSDAGNGVGLTNGEAFVGWYGVGINNFSGTPAITGTAQALGTAQADAGMADAAVTFTVGNDPDVFNVHIEGPTSAGTTSVFNIKVGINAI